MTSDPKPAGLEGTTTESGLIINYLFVKQKVRQKQLAAPFLVEREAYLRHLLEIGRKRAPVSDVANRLLHIIRNTEFTDSCRLGPREISAAANKWLQEERRTSKALSDGSARLFQIDARGFFQFLGVYEKAKPRAWFDEALEHFNGDIGNRIHRTTVLLYENLIRSFLDWVSSRRDQLYLITVSDLDDFFDEKRSAGWKPKTFALCCTALRAFFRYMEGRGLCRVNLSVAIQHPGCRVRQSNRRIPTWNQVRQRIACLDVTKPSECRAKAIFLLAAVYGLRSCEIARLTLEDFDWHNEVMTVRRAKRGRLQQFPLQYEVGNAIIRYLVNVRPSCESRNVFISLRTPHRAATNLRASVWHRLNATTIFSGPCGLHALRHACATELLRRGTSLKGIADLLGHRGLRSVSIYAHCNECALRKVANVSFKDLLS